MQKRGKQRMVSKLLNTELKKFNLLCKRTCKIQWIPDVDDDDDDDDIRVDISGRVNLCLPQDVRSQTETRQEGRQDGKQAHHRGGTNVVASGFPSGWFRLKLENRKHAWNHGSY